MVPDLPKPRFEKKWLQQVPTGLFHHDHDFESGILDQGKAAHPKGHEIEVDRLLDHLRRYQGLLFLYAKPKHHHGQDDKS